MIAKGNELIFHKSGYRINKEWTVFLNLNQERKETLESFEYEFELFNGDALEAGFFYAMYKDFPQTEVFLVTLKP